eukprot:TRINITY_DN74763_c0_g1_i1.p1 TRINITY_DN74763_c0_g1~~TRINITY_DN74763_c0_g1_i1.p1  ORF type:complete len:437 (-),score=118.30 TRINITY_DN74763_c0_g1_i1:77-1387(-)
MGAIPCSAGNRCCNGEEDLELNDLRGQVSPNVGASTDELHAPMPPSVARSGLKEQMAPPPSQGDSAKKTADCMDMASSGLADSKSLDNVLPPPADAAARPAAAPAPAEKEESAADVARPDEKPKEPEVAAAAAAPAPAEPGSAAEKTSSPAADGAEAAMPAAVQTKAVKQRRRVNGDDVRESHIMRAGSSESQTGFPARPVGCKLSQEVWDKIEKVFHYMDCDDKNLVTKEAVARHFKCAFKKISIDAMFREVDTDMSGAITGKEFADFWVGVRKSGYDEADIMAELEQLEAGGAWVDWEDGKETDGLEKQIKFPKRSFFCSLSKNAWKKCEELYHAIDKEQVGFITLESAAAFFGSEVSQSQPGHIRVSGFGGVSAKSMLNEMDVERHGRVSPQQFMEFWLQVRKSGYRNSTIIEEIELILEGNAWVDWKDERTT